MKPSLTVVIPLYNQQAVLPRLTEELLEVLPEFASSVEVVLVDDGSTDATVEIAQELSLHYPQVLLLSHPTRLGAQEALRSALRYAHGEQVLFCRDVEEFDPHELPKLLEASYDDAAVAGRWQGAAPLGSIPRPPAMSGKTPPGEAVDLLLVPRRLLTAWRQSAERGEPATYLRSRGYGLPTVVLRPRRHRRAPAALVTLLERRHAEHAAERAVARRRDTAISERSAPATSHGSNRLMSRLRALAWGE